jgi:predicted ArsR family transcriptional regulator
MSSLRGGTQPIRDNRSTRLRAARLDAEFEIRLAAAQRRLVALGLEDIFEVDGGHGRGGWGRPRHVYFEIAKHGSRAERKGEEITLEILDRLEALAARGS